MSKWASFEWWMDVDECEYGMKFCGTNRQKHPIWFSDTTRLICSDLIRLGHIVTSVLKVCSLSSHFAVGIVLYAVMRH